MSAHAAAFQMKNPCKSLNLQGCVYLAEGAGFEPAVGY